MKFEGRAHRPKSGEKYWPIEIPDLAIYTQARGESNVASMAADAIETAIDQPGFKAEVALMRDGRLIIWANEPRYLIGRWLLQLRLIKGLTVRQLAERLGASSPEAWKRYESGRSTPTVDKLAELLSAVAPEEQFTVTRRSAG